MFPPREIYMDKLIARYQRIVNLFSLYFKEKWEDSKWYTMEDQLSEAIITRDGLPNEDETVIASDKLLISLAEDLEENFKINIVEILESIRTRHTEPYVSVLDTLNEILG